MPCSCFGKKDKKVGGPLNKEEELYRPRDSRERDPAAPATAIPTGSPAQAKQQQQPLLEGAPPSTPGTPPATPTTPGGDARLRPEDDADKATRRRDVVASFYSDQCELIGFKTTGSRPPSAHVGSQQDGPAATSSPATSSPSSTRSLGASCRADLAEKRREFFRELAADDDDYRGSRPTSRLTDPGSQQTPRHSHYQEQHHTLPHNKTSPRSNKFAATHLVLQNALNRNSNPNAEENQPLLHSPSEQGPKIILAKPVSEITKLFNSKEAASESERSKEKVSDKTPLLSDEQDIDSQMVIESPAPVIVADASIIVPNVVNQSYVEENKVVISESEKVELIDVSPKEVPVITDEFKQSEIDVSFSTDFNKNSEFSVEPSLVSSELVNDKVPEEIKLVEDSTFITKPEVPVVDPCNPEISLVVDTPLLIPETKQNSVSDLAKIESHKVIDDAQIICESENGTINVKSEIPGIVDSQLTEATSPDEHLFKLDLSQETNFQTLPVIVNETLKEPVLVENKENTSENMPQNTLTFETQLEQMPQTIVETTRQFISGSPDEQKSSQTIVETTRQFITGPPDEQTTQTIIETTQQFSGNPDEVNSSQSIVETTRQFISSIPDDAESQNLMEKAQQFLSSSPDSHTIVKTTQHFVSGNPDEQVTQTIVQTTQQIVSENPDEQKTQTVIETKQSFPTNSDSFFLTSVEELDDLPENFLLQTGTTTTTVSTEEPVMFQSQLTDLPEELVEEPRLPDVPCFGAPPPPSSPPPPLPEGQVVDLLSPAPSTEQHSDQSPLVMSSEQQHKESETNSMSFTSPSSSLPQSQLEETEALPPAPPTPPTPRVDDVPPLLPSSSSPLPLEGNEQLPPTPPTPPREDDLPPALLTPTKEKIDTVTSESTTATINSTTPAVTCGVEIVSSSALEDDGLGSEIDDALETIEGLSEEGNNNNNIERAAASS